LDTALFVREPQGVGETLFVNWRNASSESVDLVWRDIYANHVMTTSSQSGRANRTHVPESKNAHPHPASPVVN
jgi:hypothetical protein